MKHKKDNKKKWMGIVVAGIIVFSMVISIFAVVVDNQDQSLPKYNKHSFISTDSGGYKTKINGKYMEFYNYPADLEAIPLSENISSKLKNSQGFGIIFDPEEPIADNLQYIDVIRYELQSQIDKPVFFGISKNSTKYPLSYIGCESATAQLPLILINISTNTSFTVSDNNPDCIIMNAKLREILAAKDRLLYTYYDVMNSSKVTN